MHGCTVCEAMRGRGREEEREGGSGGRVGLGRKHVTPGEEGEGWEEIGWRGGKLGRERKRE